MSEPRTATYFGLMPRERLEEEALRLEHATARVRKQHSLITEDGVDYCDTCSQTWPCATIAGLNGEES